MALTAEEMTYLQNQVNIAFNLPGSNAIGMSIINNGQDFQTVISNTISYY